MRIRPDTSGFGRSAERGISSSLGRLGKLAGGAFVAALGTATAGAGVGIKVAADLEQARIGFATMLGSAKEADRFLRDLSDFAARTPFDFPTLQKASSRLIAVGTEADRVIPIMTVLGDATAAMGTGAEGVDRAVMALQQMQVKGKVTGEEMLQLAEAGVPAWEALAAQLGVTTAEAQKMVTAGEVSVEDLFTAIETRQGAAFQRLGGMMEKQATTLTGLWSTAVDTVQMKLAQTMEPLIPAIKSAMQAAIPLVESGLSAIQERFGALVENTPDLLSALVGQDAQGVGETLDRILGGTGKHVDTIRTAAENLFPIWNDLVGTFGNLADIAGDLGPALGVVLGGGLRLAWEALQILAPVLRDITGWLAENEDAVWVLIGAYAAFQAIMKAHAASLAVAAAGGMVQYLKKTSLITKATKVWTAVQWLFNAALRNNPIGIVVTALAVLAGAIAYAWRNSETFRDIVTGAFEAVGDAGTWLWENALKPAWDAIQSAWDATLRGISWAWDNILKPVFNAVGDVAEALGIFLLVTVFGPIMLAWKVLTEAIKAAWTYILKPAWEAVAAAAQWLWTRVLSPVFGWIKSGWDLLLRGIQWAWTNVLKPTWDALSAAAKWLWERVLRTYFGLIGAYWRTILTAVKWAWENILRPAWDALTSAAKWLWDRVLKPIFKAIGDGWDVLLRGMKWVWSNVLSPVFRWFGDALDTLKGSFSTAVSWISRTWNNLKGALMGPVQWVVDFVWNDGLRKLWNTINDLWGGTDLKAFRLSGAGNGAVGRADTSGSAARALRYATGGIMPGYTPGRDVHTFISPTGGRLNLSGGEAVMRPEFTRAVGSGWIEQMNAAARSGGVAGVASAMTQSHARGGIISLPGWLDTALDWLPGMGSIGKIVDAINGGSGFGGGLFGSGLTGLVKGVGRRLWDAVSSLWNGSSADNAISAAVPRGTPPRGRNSAALFALIKSVFPEARLNSAYRPGDPGYHGRDQAVDLGWMRAPGGIGNAYMARMNQFIYDSFPNSRELIYNGLGDNRPNLKNGRPFAYNAATQAQHRNHVHWVYDDGGVLPPGLTTVDNRSGKPEAVFTNDEWQVFKAIAASGGASPLIGGNLVLQVSPDADVRDQMDEALFQLRRISRGGIHAR